MRVCGVSLEMGFLCELGVEMLVGGDHVGENLKDVSGK